MNSNKEMSADSLLAEYGITFRPPLTYEYFMQGQEHTGFYGKDAKYFVIQMGQLIHYLRLLFTYIQDKYVITGPTSRDAIIEAANGRGWRDQIVLKDQGVTDLDLETRRDAFLESDIFAKMYRDANLWTPTEAKDIQDFEEKVLGSRLNHSEILTIRQGDIIRRRRSAYTYNGRTPAISNFLSLTNVGTIATPSTGQVHLSFLANMPFVTNQNPWVYPLKIMDVFLRLFDRGALNLYSVIDALIFMYLNQNWGEPWDFSRNALHQEMAIERVISFLGRPDFLEAVFDVNQFYTNPIYEKSYRAFRFQETAYAKLMYYPISKTQGKLIDIFENDETNVDKRARGSAAVGRRGLPPDVTSLIATFLTGRKTYRAEEQDFLAGGRKSRRKRSVRRKSKRSRRNTRR